MNVTNLWSVPIYQSYIDLDIDGTLEYIKEQAFETDPLGISQYTVNKYVHKDDYMKDIVLKVKEQSKIYIDQVLGYDINNDYSIEIKTSWAARAKPGGYCNRHYHGMSLITGILYLSVDSINKSNKVLFHNPHNSNSYMRLPIAKWNEHNCLVYSVVPEPKKFVLFPSNIDHSTEENTTNENLYSIVFDFNVRGVLGKGSHSETFFS